MPRPSEAASAKLAAAGALALMACAAALWLLTSDPGPGGSSGAEPRPGVPAAPPARGTALTPSTAPTAAAQAPEPAALGERRIARVPPAPGAAGTHALAGRVVDGAGEPVPSFELVVVAQRKEARASAFFYREHHADPAGRFVVPEVPTGTWLVIASSEESAPPARETVTVPRAAELVLVLLGPGSVAGVVRDPFGAPLAGARVVYGAGKRETLTREDGRFAIALEGGKRTSLFATAAGCGPSDLRELVVPPETEVEIELSLVVEAAVAGVVLDEQGRPDPGTDVRLGAFRDQRQLGDLKQAADPDGRFEFRGLTAGSYLALVDEGGDPPEGQRALRAEQVTVAAGETIEVVLGGLRADTLQLDVSVTLAGVPCVSGTVYLFPEGPNFLASTQEARLDSLGRVSFRLAGPGRYAVRAERGDLNKRAHVTRTILVPDVPVHAVELALPTAALGGRVLGPDGPLEAHAVRLVRERAWDPTTLGQGKVVETDAQGAFWFEGLPPGHYSLGGDRVPPIRDIELGPHERRGGFELTPVAGGDVLGRVLGPSGEPVGAAAVYARGPQGRWHTHWAGAISRPGTGAFGFESLPPGDYTFFARQAELASPESAPVRVVAGEAREVELRLGPGAMLRLALVDADGAPVVAEAFRALDSEGRSFGEPRSAYDLELFLLEGFQAGGRIVGPLPPGSWRLEASARDGRQAAASAKLGAGWNDVELKLH